MKPAAPVTSARDGLKPLITSQWDRSGLGPQVRVAARFDRVHVQTERLRASGSWSLGRGVMRCEERA
jgi:hypothetical protein